ncbi:uncharacterized protein LOC143850840 isoform X2 [Tasmannia lanceolata]|uniref:uncharacterized protein LOC143850840 isoform X2 n=1 Tax=Tasmannia lanceolata TaxID=3420 RepID=UPI004063D79A
MAGNTNSSNFQSVPLFKGDNFQFWSIKMKMLFMSYELWELVENGYENFVEVERLTAAQKNEFKESKKKDAQALFLIEQAMDEPIFPTIMATTTSKEAWDLLQEEYQDTTKINLSSGRLQLVDATGSIDVVIPDLLSDGVTNNIYEEWQYQGKWRWNVSHADGNTQVSFQPDTQVSFQPECASTYHCGNNNTLEG